MLTPEGPKGTRQGSPTQRQQRSQGLVGGALARTGLGEGWNPGAQNLAECVEQNHRFITPCEKYLCKKKEPKALAATSFDSTDRLPRSGLSSDGNSQSIP